jgi:hypothetical protein
MELRCAIKGKRMEKVERSKRSKGHFYGFFVMCLIQRETSRMEAYDTYRFWWSCWLRWADRSPGRWNRSCPSPAPERVRWWWNYWIYCYTRVYECSWWWYAQVAYMLLVVRFDSILSWWFLGLMLAYCWHHFLCSFFVLMQIPPGCLETNHPTSLDLIMNTNQPCFLDHYRKRSHILSFSGID